MKLRAQSRTLWNAIKQYGKDTNRGAILGIVASAEIILTAAGFYWTTGLGKVFDMLILLTSVNLVGAFSWFVGYYGLLLLFKWVPFRIPLQLPIAVFLSSSVIYKILNELHTGYKAEIFFTIVLVGIGYVTGSACEWIIQRPYLIGAKMYFVFAMGMVIYSCYWTLGDGRDPYQYQVTSNAFSKFGQLQKDGVENPGLRGDYPVLERTYGSGNMRPRPEFSQQRNYETPVFDGTDLITDWSWLRTLFWGFKPDELPLNGTIYMPDGEGPFPLVLIVHGNHIMEEFSDPGYRYLTELLASRGFIAVSVDENFLNGSWWKGIEGDYKARAMLLLEHLRQFERWNTEVGHELYGKIDMDRIALIGHSRGGQAAVMAAAYNRMDHDPKNQDRTWDYGFAIRSVVAIAPTDASYGEAKATSNDISYLLLQGANDSDVNWFSGDRQFDRIKYRFQDTDYRFKSSLYIEGANHGQFNSVWGSNDLSFPRRLLLNKDALMEEKQQQQIAKVWISGFLEATLHSKLEYIPMFQDYRLAGDWLPQTVYIQRFSDTSFQVWCDFEDSDKENCANGQITAQVEEMDEWKEDELNYRIESYHRQNDVVVLRWSSNAEGTEARYTLNIKEGSSLGHIQSSQWFQFDLSRVSQWKSPDHVMPEDIEPMNIAVELKDQDGQTARVDLNEELEVPPVIRTRFTKTEWLDRWVKNGKFGEDHEPVLQTYRLPFLLFQQKNTKLNLSKLQSISFVFSKERSGGLLLDQIGVAGR